MYMYHLVANLEERFACIGEALEHYAPDLPVFPKVPTSRMLFEDGITPRICVAPSVEECITAMGIRRFERCIADECIPEYLKNEVYPVLLLSFSENEDYYSPTSQELPDCDITCEQWLLKPTVPERVQMLWLSADSLECYCDWEYPEYDTCAYVDCLTEPPPGADHPWLNGRGHSLNGLTSEQLRSALILCHGKRLLCDNCLS